jgi:hypothetical protein
MTLSDTTRRALRAYDSFTDFARCADLPWSPDVYERLDDEIAQTLLHAFCYVWAASQQAAGVFSGSVPDLAITLLEALPSWDETATQQGKVEWTLSLGVKSVLFQLDPRSPALPASDHTNEPVSMSSADCDAVEDMAVFFRIARSEATLLFQIGRALGKESPEPAAQVEVGAQKTIAYSHQTA